MSWCYTRNSIFNRSLTRLPNITPKIIRTLSWCLGKKIQLWKNSKMWLGLLFALCVKHRNMVEKEKSHCLVLRVPTWQKVFPCFSEGLLNISPWMIPSLNNYFKTSSLTGYFFPSILLCRAIMICLRVFFLNIFAYLAWGINRST